jgi:hypothetical protein
MLSARRSLNFSAAILFTLSLAGPAIADSQTASSVDPSLCSSALDTYGTATSSALDRRTSAEKAALSARVTAMKAAALLTDRVQRSTAAAKSQQTYDDALSAASDQYQQDVDSANAAMQSSCAGILTRGGGRAPHTPRAGSGSTIHTHKQRLPHTGSGSRVQPPKNDIYERAVWPDDSGNQDDSTWDDNSGGDSVIIDDGNGGDSTTIDNGNGDVSNWQNFTPPRQPHTGSGSQSGWSRPHPPKLSPLTGSGNSMIPTSNLHLIRSHSGSDSQSQSSSVSSRIMRRWTRHMYE